jgi:GAF domain-containing protein
VGFQAVVDELIEATGASRCTLRQEVEGAYFPVTHEALAPGAPSIRDVRTVNLRTMPVVHRLLETGQQVVQDDCATDFPDDPGFQGMLDAFGGLAAQVVTPVFVGDRLRAIVSIHQLEEPRRWRDEELDAAREAAERVRTLLDA